ncbi:MAG: RNA polymerase sigma factor RpoD/SigA, partial [Bacteroidota bacterium]
MKIKFGDSKNVNNDLSVGSYLRDIRKYKPLSRKEESELLKRVKAGDRAATEKLISSNLLFVVSVANQYANRGLPLSDLIAEGNIGMINAVKKFDETRQHKFISYAVWWIRQAILKALAEQTNIVRFPINQIEDLEGINRTSQSLSQSLGRSPTLPEVAEGASMSLKRAERALVASLSDVSLDSPIDTDEEVSLYNLIPAGGPSADEEISAKSLADAISDSMSSLTSREAKIVKLYFGLEGDPVTLEKIGSQMGMTRERARQIR